MGSSKTTERQNQTQTRDPYNPAKPAIDQSIRGVQSWLSNPASKAAYDWQMDPFTTAGVENLGASKGAMASRDYLTGVLNGNYLNAGNPYQADLDRSILESVMPAVNSTFSNAGMAGSTLHQNDFTKATTSALAAPRYQNYQFERGNQQQAAGLLPDVDNLISQNQITAGQTREGYDRARFEEQRTAGLRPYLETQGLLNTYGNMGGTSTSKGTTTSESTPSMGSQIGGAAMMGLGMMTGNPMLAMGGAGMLGGGGMMGGGGSSSGGSMFGQGLMGGGASYGSSGSYAPSYSQGLPWAPDRGLNPWGYTIS